MKVKPPKPELKKEPGEWEVYRVMSESEPGTYHVVAVQYQEQWADDSKVYEEVPVDWLCSCKGFNYNKWCWHVESLGCEG